MKIFVIPTMVFAMVFCATAYLALPVSFHSCMARRGDLLTKVSLAKICYAKMEASNGR